MKYILYNNLYGNTIAVIKGALCSFGEHTQNDSFFSLFTNTV